MLKLDVGCGQWKIDGYKGVDINPDSVADVVCDIDLGLPFPDNSTDAIYCSHFLEHTKNVLFILDEFYRVCINGSVIHIIVPLLEWHSEGHYNNFSPGWFHRFVDKNKFDIEHLSIIEKQVCIPILNPDVNSYFIFEKELKLTVKK